MDTAPVVAVVGSGYAGFTAARTLERLLGRDEATLIMVSDADHLNYASLLPQVAAGVLDPRHNAVALHRVLSRTRILLGTISNIDLHRRTITIARRADNLHAQPWDLLLLTPGSVPKPAPVPGITACSFRFHSLADAVLLRDQVLYQLECADACTDASQRQARCTFVVIGAGYSGTELAAQMMRLTHQVLPRFPTLSRTDLRWLLVEAGPTILRELDRRLARHAMRRLTARGLDVRISTTVTELADDRVRLSDGEVLPTHTVVWTAGVTPSPLVDQLALPTEAGRLSVGTDLRVPGHPDVLAAGDAAAVPDLTRPGRLCAMTAQHATRQGRRAAENIAALLRGRPLRDYRHHDLGFVVDLGGRDAAANPLGVPLHGLPAKVVTSGYHLMAMPTLANSVRIGTDWLLDLVLPQQAVRLGFVPDPRRSPTADVADPASVPDERRPA